MNSQTIINSIIGCLIGGILVPLLGYDDFWKKFIAIVLVLIFGIYLGATSMYRILQREKMEIINETNP